MREVKANEATYVFVHVGDDAMSECIADVELQALFSIHAIADVQYIVAKGLEEILLDMTRAMPQGFCGEVWTTLMRKISIKELLDHHSIKPWESDDSGREGGLLDHVASVIAFAKVNHRWDQQAHLGHLHHGHQQRQQVWRHPAQRALHGAGTGPAVDGRHRGGPGLRLPLLALPQAAAAAGGDRGDAFFTLGVYIKDKHFTLFVYPS